MRRASYRGLLHVRTIACSTMYRDAEAKVLSHFARFIPVPTEKKITKIAIEGIFSKVKALANRHLFTLHSYHFQDRAYSLDSNFVYINDQQTVNFGKDWM